MIKLSLIVPIYKVEKYIIECIESICCQLVDGVEVILVNDGTPDSSMQIAKEYINDKYSQYLNQFVFIDQENQGLSGARNTGIREAKGEYLMFLDSDDILEDGCIYQIFKILEENEVDLIQFKAYRFRDFSKEKVNFMPDSPFVGNHLINNNILEFVFNTSNWFSWLRVYHKKLFRDRIFPLGKFYEDAYTTPFIFLDVKKICFVNENLLGYRINNQGITAKITEKSLDDLKGIAELFTHNIPKCSYFSLSLISISQYYITQSLKSEGIFQAIQRWSELKKMINESKFDEKSLKNRGNKLFYQFGVVFLVLEQLLLKLKVK
ncbi:glycosyltransferase family 2 protein [Acinetobacter schindleri]|uniref:glycosyltransferase family 2 protein n=1 Tax=Acinetobacter schindleri TaxID=108981 RepID=UPI0013B08A25|nr:glycosyltransferase family 2 protein [Acinetobacter schindleri]QIC61254.1 glycosyltransferase family 2 protein [Acinetobacter schindleri]